MDPCPRRARASLYRIHYSTGGRFPFPRFASGRGKGNSQAQRNLGDDNATSTCVNLAAKVRRDGPARFTHRCAISP